MFKRNIFSHNTLNAPILFNFMQNIKIETVKEVKHVEEILTKKVLNKSYKSFFITNCYTTEFNYLSSLKKNYK